MDHVGSGRDRRRNRRAAYSTPFTGASARCSPWADRKVGRPHIVPVEGMLELLQALKAKGYRLYLLSNAATRQPIYWARAEASKLMDGVLISAEVKLLKPDPQIYRTFLHKFALRPEECVFIDDTPINVEGALYENMAGIVFNMDVPALAESLRTLGVEW